jgi:hypothetical protein
MENFFPLLSSLITCNLQGIKFDDDIVAKNKKILESESFKKQLQDNTILWESSAQLSACTPIACDPYTGEIYPYEDSIMNMSRDPNGWICTFKFEEKDAPKYYLYCNSHWRRCIDNLIATERSIHNTGSGIRITQWERGIKNKLETIKIKYGFIQALRWNTQYDFLMESKHLYTWKELWKK